MISIIAVIDASAKNNKIVRECKGDEAIARLPDGGKCVTRKVPSKTKDVHFLLAGEMRRCSSSISN